MSRELSPTIQAPHHLIDSPLINVPPERQRDALASVLRAADRCGDFSGVIEVCEALGLPLSPSLRERLA